MDSHSKMSVSELFIKESPLGNCLHNNETSEGNLLFIIPFIYFSK